MYVTKLIWCDIVDRNRQVHSFSNCVLTNFYEYGFLSINYDDNVYFIIKRDDVCYMKFEVDKI